MGTPVRNQNLLLIVFRPRHGKAANGFLHIFPNLSKSYHLFVASTKISKLDSISCLAKLVVACPNASRERSVFFSLFHSFQAQVVRSSFSLSSCLQKRNPTADCRRRR